MSKEKAFGIGCFHFGIKRKPPFEFSGEEYLKELTNCLNQIPNLKNIKIQTDGDFEKRTTYIVNKLPSLNDINFFPCPSFLRLEFEIHIPHCLQVEIFSNIFGTGGSPETYSENFKITLLYDYFAPVAVIEIINPSKTSSPSDAVVLARKFLEKEIGKNKTHFITFENLGPSPFHADFFLEPKSNDGARLFSLEKKAQIGYDKITIYYNEQTLSNADKALNNIIPVITAEFGFYYQWMQVRSSRMDSWQKIENNLQELVRIQKSTKLINFFKRMYLKHSLIEKIFIDVVNMESQDISINKIIKNDYRDVYHSKEDALFKALIDNELEENNDYPSKQTIDLISFIESRRVKNIEFVTIIVAAILGGVIGSLLTN